MSLLSNQKQLEMPLCGATTAARTLVSFFFFFFLQTANVPSPVTLGSVIFRGSNRTLISIFVSPAAGIPMGDAASAPRPDAPRAAPTLFDRLEEDELILRS
ncbi:hypothetical protein AMECASPLE_017444 [Ameca splendens]|uniref:Secreted protein n=1 Tax=Ameca splendens TaxID=208324 RepID=A0ABV0ZMB5_9TELE